MRGSAWKRETNISLAEDVGERHERHALVVGEVGADHGRARGGLRRSVDLAAARVVVERFVEAEPAFKAHAREPLEVLGRERRCDQARQCRGVRGNDQVGGQAALESKAGHAERPVLIVPGAIRKRVRRLRDAPRHVALAAVFDLASDACAAALVEQRSREVSHQELRHQVLEHRAAPGHQRRAAVHVRDETSEVKPVVLRDVTLRDGDEAGQPRFRRQQIVEGGVESSWSLGVGEAVSD